MITETGYVTIVEEGKAFVAIEKIIACADCQAGCSCHPEKKVILVKTKDPIGVQPNQRVNVYIPDGPALQTALVVYGVPLMGLLIGILLGQYLGKLVGFETLCEILGGLGGFAVALLVVKQYSTRYQRQHDAQPVIMNVIAPIPEEDHSLARASVL